MGSEFSVRTVNMRTQASEYSKQAKKLSANVSTLSTLSHDLTGVGSVYDDISHTVKKMSVQLDDIQKTIGCFGKVLFAISEEFDLTEKQATDLVEGHGKAGLLRPQVTIVSGDDTEKKKKKKKKKKTTNGTSEKKDDGSSKKKNDSKKKDSKKGDSGSTGSGSGYNTITKAGKDFTKKKEGCSLTSPNGGLTIGYGIDVKNFPNLKINYVKPGVITQAEADRIFDIVYGGVAKNVDAYLKKKNYKLDNSTYAAVVDLCYNRGCNDMTMSVIDAMANDDTAKVKKLFSNFDYEYAMRKLHMSSAEAKAYVTRNRGLATRRQEELNMYLKHLS